MTWNYRILKSETGYSIREVYYDDNGNIEGWTSTACEPSGEDMDDLEDDFEGMRLAFHRPVLDEKQLLAELSTGHEDNVKG